MCVAMAWPDRPPTDEVVNTPDYRQLPMEDIPADWETAPKTQLVHARISLENSKWMKPLSITALECLDEGALRGGEPFRFPATLMLTWPQRWCGKTTVLIGDYYTTAEEHILVPILKLHGFTDCFVDPDPEG